MKEKSHPKQGGEGGALMKLCFN